MTLGIAVLAGVAGFALCVQCGQACEVKVTNNLSSIDLYVDVLGEDGESAMVPPDPKFVPRGSDETVSLTDCRQEFWLLVVDCDSGTVHKIFAQDEGFDASHKISIPSLGPVIGNRSCWSMP